MNIAGKKICKSFITLIATVLFLLSASPALALHSPAHDPNHAFPRTANYFLKWTLTEAEARELAKWDLVILDMELQTRAPDLLKKMRTLNPNIILLVYITPQEIRQDASRSFSLMRQKLARGIADDWYLKNSAGEKITWWPGTHLLNVTNEAPAFSNQRWNEYLVNFVTNNLLSSGLWDGVFYDNAWDDITHFAGTDIDANRDRRIDDAPVANKAWQQGMQFIYNSTRDRVSSDIIVVGNGTTRAYRDHLNGNLIENFLPFSWEPTMNTYRYVQDTKQEPALSVINANIANGAFSQSDYQRMRFGLGSTLLEDGYFSFDYGDKDHSQLWWYDEYAVDLGQPIAEAESAKKAKPYTADIWRRDFERGISVLNSTPGAQSVSLNGEFEKLHGTQDPKVNDGAIVSELRINSNDSILLLKTFATLQDVLFSNGSFVRFLRPDGTRVRNGLFLFEEGYKGEDQIAHIDLNGDDVRDFFLATGNRIISRRSDNQPFTNFYPYTVRYPGEMRVALGDIDGDHEVEYVVAPGPGSTEPIRVYNFSGRLIVDSWYPFGQGYKGGYSVAIGKVEPNLPARIIIGGGSGIEPRVVTYGVDLKRKHEWLAFEKTFRGGVFVAAGDLDGDGVDEVVTGPGPGGKPLIKTFTGEGKEASPSFVAYSTFGYPGLRVGVADVDFDGKKDILAVSEGI